MPVRTRLETEVPEPIRDILKKTAVGKATPPQAAQKGYEMLALCNKREIQSNAAARMEIEDELRNKEGEQMSRRLLREMRLACHHRLSLSACVPAAARSRSHLESPAALDRT